MFYAQIQTNKQTVSSLKGKSQSEAIQALHPGDMAGNRVCTRWSSDEAQMAIKGFRKHGKNYPAIAEIIGTKNEQHVRQFYTNNRKRYNLDNIVKEFEVTQQQHDQNVHSNDAPAHLTASKTVSSSSDVKNEPNQPSTGNEAMDVSIGCWQNEIQTF